MTSTWVEKTSSPKCGWRSTLSLRSHLSECVSQRTHTHTPALLGSSPRFTNLFPSCSGGATLLDSRARLCQGRPHHRSAALPLIPGSQPGLSASLGHSFPLLALSRPRVLCFQGSKIAISSPQGLPGFPGPGPRLTHSPWSRRRPLDEFALLRSYLLAELIWLRSPSVNAHS